MDNTRILVLGGVGSMGRNFVKYCVDNELCSYIRVADKAIPMTSYFKYVFQKDYIMSYTNRRLF